MDVEPARGSLQWGLAKSACCDVDLRFELWGTEALPIVSIVVPFWGLPYRILIIYLVKPKKGTRRLPFWGYLIGILIIYLLKPKKGNAMETIGRVQGLGVREGLV